MNFDKMKIENRKQWSENQSLINKMYGTQKYIWALQVFNISVCPIFLGC